MYIEYVCPYYVDRSVGSNWKSALEQMISKTGIVNLFFPHSQYLWVSVVHRMAGIEEHNRVHVILMDVFPCTMFQHRRRPTDRTFPHIRTKSNEGGRLLPVKMMITSRVIGQPRYQLTWCNSDEWMITTNSSSSLATDEISSPLYHCPCPQ